ncbi:uncharacterized protein LOC106703193 [Latimeria chalumnae]|uniref:uncharacterized protein LOC106703193 n=1 Tax=Latimeria chalumnae TaxID=7897 RepID=UPI0006D932E3|nr:PREDICTED: uncharacterized protein LOC106703193 [Latimeria chalumnae]|eukprot:XP_014342950.1 PREDICTED: uncharacterized protein LOC106703193 [Latimeria chalumnae]
MDDELRFGIGASQEKDQHVSQKDSMSQRLKPEKEAVQMTGKAQSGSRVLECASRRWYKSRQLEGRRTKVKEKNHKSVLQIVTQRKNKKPMSPAKRARREKVEKNSTAALVQRGRPRVKGEQEEEMVTEAQECPAMDIATTPAPDTDGNLEASFNSDKEEVMQDLIGASATGQGEDSSKTETVPEGNTKRTVPFNPFIPSKRLRLVVSHGSIDLDVASTSSEDSN